MGIPLPHSSVRTKSLILAIWLPLKWSQPTAYGLSGFASQINLKGVSIYGQKKKCEQIKRTNNVMVRFTDAEYASISISAEQAGYPVAVYVRKSALDERIEVHYNITAELPELQKLIAEYSAIGNNLNQIAQYFHSGGFYSKSMQDEINRHLTALWQLRQEAIKLGGTYHGRVKTHRNKKR